VALLRFRPIQFSGTDINMPVCSVTPNAFGHHLREVCPYLPQGTRIWLQTRKPLLAGMCPVFVLPCTPSVSSELLFHHRSKEPFYSATKQNTWPCITTNETKWQGIKKNNYTISRYVTGKKNSTDSNLTTISLLIQRINKVKTQSISVTGREGL
jgi:hypothetical protein